MGLFQGDNYVAPTKLSGIRLGTSVFNTRLPIIIGQQRGSWKLLWYGDFTAQKAKTPGGGSGLSKGGTQYVYAASVIGSVCMGPCANFLGVWDSIGKYAVDVYTESSTLGAGPNPTYTPANAAIFSQDLGAGLSQAYSVTVNDYGSPGPVTLTGTQQHPLYYTASPTPGDGEYTVAFTGPGGSPVYTFNGAQTGQVAVVSYVAFRYKIQESENSTIPNFGPFTVTVQYQTQFSSDAGCTFYPSGVALTPVSGSPTITGTYNPNGGNYQFAPVDAGVAVTINYIYSDPNTDSNAPSTLNLTFFGGGLGQAPWSYLTSKHPGEALGYSEIAYIASSGLYLGYAAVLPQYNFEILGSFSYGNGIPDACPADALYQLMANPAYKILFPSAYIHHSLTGMLSGGGIPMAAPHAGSIGTGYHVNDVVAVVQTGGSGGQLKVLSVDGGGGVTGLAVQSAGTNYFLAMGLKTTGGTGSGLQVDIGNFSSAKAMWVANNFFISALLDSPSPLMQHMGTWCEAGQAFVSWDEGMLKFIPLCDTSAVANGIQYAPPTQPVTDLDDNDFVVAPGQDPITIEQAPWQSRWNRVSVAWSVRSNSYNEDVMQAQDEASVQQWGLLSEGAQGYQFLCTQAAAQYAANMRLQRYSAIYTTYRATLKANFAFLSPGDIITVTDGLLGTSGTMFGRTPIRITKMTDDPKKGVIIEGENFPWSVGAALLGNKQASIPSNTGDGPQQDPGPTTAIIFEVPDRAAQFGGNKIYIFINGSQVNWGGAEAYVSLNGTDYSYYGSYDTPGRIGVVVTDFPIPAGFSAGDVLPFLDNANVLTVNMQQSGAVLQSVTAADRDAFVTLCALVSVGQAYNLEKLATLGANLGQSTSLGTGGSQGPLATTLGTDDPSISSPPSTVAWTNPNNVTGSGSYATAACSTTGVTISGSVTARFYNHQHSFAGQCELRNPADNSNNPGSGFYTTQQTATGSSLLFNPPQYNGRSDPLVQPMQWAKLNSSGVITGYSAPWSGANQNYNMIVTGSLTFAAAGTYVITIAHDDGMYWAMGHGVGTSAAVALASGPTNCPAPYPTKTALNGYSFTGLSAVGANNVSGNAAGDTWTITVSQADTYPFEICYCNWENEQQLCLYVGGNTPYPASGGISSFSHGLDCTKFGFSLQAGIGPIIGLQVSCQAFVSAFSATSGKLYAQLLYQGARIGGQILVHTFTTTTTSTVYQAGSLTTVAAWNLPTRYLTQTVINDPTFGVQFEFVVDANTPGSATCQVNDVLMEIAWSAGGAAVGWTNPQNVGSAVSYASAALVASGFTQSLGALTFNFNQPFGFSLNGIQVTINAYTASSTAIIIVQLYFAGIYIGSAQAQRVSPGAGGTDYIFGNSTFLWSAEGTLDLDVINSQGLSGFGCVLYMEGVLGDTMFVRNVRMTISGESTTNLELISYENADLSGLNTYDLSSIDRGVYGSYPCDHPPGANFARLDQATIIYQVDPTYHGPSIFFKFLSFNAYGNQLQSLNEAVPYEVVLTGLSPGAIDNATGALLTGTPNWQVPLIEQAMVTLHATYGLQNIPAGYALVGPQNRSSGVPQWTPVLTGGGGDGSVYNLFVLTAIANLTLAAWDYALCNTSGGAFTLTLPSAASNPNTVIGFKKMTADANAVTVNTTGLDTVENVASLTFGTFNESIYFASDGVANWVISHSYVPLPNAQLGDIIRWNVLGDNAWDAVNASVPVSAIYPIMGGFNQGFGLVGTGNASDTGGASTFEPATRTTGPIRPYSAAATANTSPVMGFNFGHNGNTSVNMIMGFSRWSMKIAFGGFSNVRYWIGNGCFNNLGLGSIGNNGLLMLGNTSMCNDNPNRTMIGFRFSAGVDTHWQAYSQNAANPGPGARTVVDTGVTPDTNPHVYEMACNFAGTELYFFIDRVLVATITTNLPTPGTGQYHGEPFWTGDNKNTNTAMSASYYYWICDFKL